MKNLIYLYLSTVLLIFLTIKVTAQPTIEWLKCLGGSIWDVGRDIKQTQDGGYIVAGYAMSNDGDVSGNHSDYFDDWIVKITANGKIQWQKCYGGRDEDYAFSIALTLDGGYIIAGESDSYDGDVTGNHGADMWVVKIESIGTLQWQKCLGGRGNE